MASPMLLDKDQLLIVPELTKRHHLIPLQLERVRNIPRAKLRKKNKDAEAECTPPHIIVTPPHDRLIEHKKTTSPVPGCSTYPSRPASPVYAWGGPDGPEFVCSDNSRPTSPSYACSFICRPASVCSYTDASATAAELAPQIQHDDDDLLMPQVDSYIRGIIGNSLKIVQAENEEQLLQSKVKSYIGDIIANSLKIVQGDHETRCDEMAPPSTVKDAEHLLTEEDAASHAGCGDML